MPLQLNDDSLLRQQCWIAGQWRDAASGLRFAVRNPANGETLAEVPLMTDDETRQAIAAAHAALPAWRALPGKARAAILRRWFDLLLQNQDDLAQIMTAEQGKPLAEARGEITYAASFIEWFAEEGKRTYGDTVPHPQAGLRIVVLKQAVGVVAAITPWNFPAAMITRKVAPALAAGCTLVLKPASQTPLTALALLTLAERAGVPAGVLNVVTGPAAAIGAELCRNPDVRKLSFTGSTVVGRRLMADCAPTIKKLSLELGGNAPFIVFDDADLDAAVQGALQSKFRNAGQTCVCANRILVHDAVYDDFARRLTQAAAQLQVGDGRLPETQIGPLIDAAAVAKVEQHIADALAGGAQLLLGGQRHALGGHFFSPTILSGATADMQLAHEETFGPLAALFRFHDEAEAIALANASEFGLAAYFYSQNLARVWRVAEALECGMVGINTGLISNEAAPFGGVKQSGLGREGSHYGIDEYLELKYLCLAVE